MTNFTKLRNMNPEEFVKWAFSACETCAHKDKPECDAHPCREGYVKWLLQPVDEAVWQKVLGRD